MVFFVSSGLGTICVDCNNHELKPEVCIAVEVGETHEIINTGAENLVSIYFGIRN